MFLKHLRTSYSWQDNIRQIIENFADFIPITKCIAIDGEMHFLYKSKSDGEKINLFGEFFACGG